MGLIPALRMADFPLVRLRLTQGKRITFDLGSYAVFLFIAGIVLVAYVFLMHGKPELSFWLFNAWYIVLIWIHFSRKDLPFVFKNIERPHFSLSTEYLFISLPFMIAASNSSHKGMFALLLCLCFLLPYFPVFHRRFYGHFIIKYLPPTVFEWKSGLRKYFFAFVLLYAIALAVSWFKIFPLFVLWLLTTLIMSFYDENEEVKLLFEMPEMSSLSYFKKSKIMQQYFLFYMCRYY